MKIKDLFELLNKYDQNDQVNFYNDTNGVWMSIKSVEDEIDTDSGKRTKSIDINLVEP